MNIDELLKLRDSTESRIWELDEVRAQIKELIDSQADIVWEFNIGDGFRVRYDYEIGRFLSEVYRDDLPEDEKDEPDRWDIEQKYRSHFELSVWKGSELVDKLYAWNPTQDEMRKLWVKFKTLYL